MAQKKGPSNNNTLEVQFTSPLHTEFLNYLRNSSSGTIGSNVNITAVGGAALQPLGGVDTVPVSIYNTAGLVESLGGGGSATATANFRSPDDLTAAYASTSTLTLSALKNFTITQDSQIVYVKVIPTSTASDGAVYINGSNDYTFRYSGGILTAYKEGAIVEIFTTGDNYEVGINAQEKAFSPDNNAMMVSILNATYRHYLGAQTLASAYNVVDAAAHLTVVGTAISVTSYKNCKFGVVVDINNDTDVVFQVRGLLESGGVEYPLGSDIVKVNADITWTDYTGAADTGSFVLDNDADQNILIDVTLDNSFVELKLYAMCTEVDDTCRLTTVKYTLGY